MPIGVWIRPTTYIEGGNMKQCIHCRFGNPEDAKFCRRAAERSGTR
ncbi:hypothetical protein BIFANG_03027 [Bifidobacterium angulatum DSM 20098 = JCM 7096]|uniref:Uncharacterized protein n=1 Tax=Bifidobacterium angulatum DSM 20098 = JCM 7096 TaxID=518635 RepID=C4FFC7_9BIFI|nr:hypothetical protein BIFANG_03027 [Bifidobacterium angulatum DSM 20098 = JCM 7096]